MNEDGAHFLGRGRAWPRSRACLKIGRAGMRDVGTGVLIGDSTRAGRISRIGVHFFGLNLLQQVQPLNHGQSSRVMITGT